MILMSKTNHTWYGAAATSERELTEDDLALGEPRAVRLIFISRSSKALAEGCALRRSFCTPLDCPACTSALALPTPAGNARSPSSNSDTYWGT